MDSEGTNGFLSLRRTLFKIFIGLCRERKRGRDDWGHACVLCHTFSFHCSCSSFVARVSSVEDLEAAGRVWKRAGEGGWREREMFFIFVLSVYLEASLSWLWFHSHLLFQPDGARRFLLVLYMGTYLHSVGTCLKNKASCLRTFCSEDLAAFCPPCSLGGSANWGKQQKNDHQWTAGGGSSFQSRPCQPDLPPSSVEAIQRYLALSIHLPLPIYLSRSTSRYLSINVSIYVSIYLALLSMYLSISVYLPRSPATAVPVYTWLPVCIYLPFICLFLRLWALCKRAWPRAFPEKDYQRGRREDPH